jgi:glutaminyl-tRNA synthetase
MNLIRQVITTAYVEPSLATVSISDQFQFQVWGIFAVDKDSTSSKLVFNKTVGLKMLGKKKKTQILSIMLLKDINKFLKK